MLKLDKRCGQMIEFLHREKTDKLKKAAAYGFVKKPKVARPYMQKIGRALSKVVSMVWFSAILTTGPVWRSVAKDIQADTVIENPTSILNVSPQDVLTNVKRLASVIDDVGDYIKRNPDVKLDISNISFSADDIAQMRGKGCEQAKALEKIAKTVSTESGYCARAVKRIVHRAGLLKDCSVEERAAFLNVGAAWQLKPFFDNGSVNGVVAINLDEDASRARKPMLMFRVNEQWEGGEHDARGNEVPNDAHIQVEGEGGYYFGQRNHNACPYGHRDKTGIIHEYGAATYYAFSEDISLLMQCVAEDKNLMAVRDDATNTLVCFSADNVPEQYKDLLAQYNAAEANLHQQYVMSEDALRVEPAVLDTRVALCDETMSQQQIIQKKINYPQENAAKLAMNIRKSRMI